MTTMLPPPNIPARVDITDLVRMQFERNARALAQLNAKQVKPADSLEAAVDDWWCSLPLVTRNRRYQLIEISDALFQRTGRRFADRDITAALESRNWTSGRSWTRAWRNRRWHQPPQL